VKTRITLSLLLLFFGIAGYNQGRVVINEYLPWPLNSCSVTSEFIELTNMGPGPMNIGCWLLTDGDYSITIPANTVLQPGAFYVIAGQDSLPIPCGNTSSPVIANLNWNTCNCSSGSIPTTGDGFLTDGGSANEQLVLLDNHLNLVDAIVRKLPAETNSSITTSASSSGCTPQNFNLDTYSFTYETVGESAGRGNSFARRLDGDCTWLKDTQQSGGATNNTPGDASSISGSLTIVNSQSCLLNGSVSVLLTGTGTLFPVTYILARDVDEDGIFETTDSYQNGMDASGPAVEVAGLAPGVYQLVITPATGCGQVVQSFRIFECNMGVLDRMFTQFSTSSNGNRLLFSWTLAELVADGNFVLERSVDGVRFTPVRSVVANGGMEYSAVLESSSSLQYYRVVFQDQGSLRTTQILKVVPGSGVQWKSWEVQRLSRGLNGSGAYLEIENQVQQDFGLRVIDALGVVRLQRKLGLGAGLQRVTLEIGDLRGAWMVEVVGGGRRAIVR
jgi:hypothetical protein